MPYRSSDKTRRKKDAKRTAMMQAAVRVFAEKGFYAATVRDIVHAADVAIGTFYFYFPDKETLFVHLYEETADFLLQTIYQAVNGKKEIREQIKHGIQAYINIAVFEPAIIHLLLVGGVGAVPSLTTKRNSFRERLLKIWQRPLDEAVGQTIAEQNTFISAAAIAGACDEVVLQLLARPNPDIAAETAQPALIQFILNAIGLNQST